jgi:hypothetical protein
MTAPLDGRQAAGFYGKPAAGAPEIGSLSGECGLIPSPADHDLYAQLQTPMDIIRQGWSVSLFEALRQWSTMLSQDWKTRSKNQLSRMNCQTFSMALSSGLILSRVGGHLG